ncbi:hypothetical protein B0H12DRAFT_1137001, partial [Mycena haematopus]
MCVLLAQSLLLPVAIGIPLPVPSRPRRPPQPHRPRSPPRPCLFSPSHPSWLSLRWPFALVACACEAATPHVYASCPLPSWLLLSSASASSISRQGSSRRTEKQRCPVALGPAM